MASVVRVVIPDSGVLISLAKAGLLELLVVFRPNVEIVITDVVEYEVTRRLDKSDAKIIRDFLTRNQSRVRIDETSFAPLLAKTRASAEDLLPADVGELSVYSYIRSARVENPGVPTLVLFEDDWFVGNAISIRPGNIHLLSTFAFIKGLEKLQPKFSSSAALKLILKARPTVNRVVVDESAPKILEGTEWKPAVDGERVARAGKRLR